MKVTDRDLVNIKLFLHALSHGFARSICHAYNLMRGSDLSINYLTSVLTGIIDRALRQFNQIQGGIPFELAFPFVHYDGEFAVVILPVDSDLLECRLEWTQRMGTQYVTEAHDDPQEITTPGNGTNPKPSEGG